MTDKKRHRTSHRRQAEGAPEAAEYYARIPEGEYDAYCYKTKEGPGFGGRRNVYVFFRIYGGEYHDTKLFMACTYPPGKMSPRHKYYQQWVIANGGIPKRGQRLARKVFPKKMYRVLVRDTKKKHSNNRPMAEAIQYSVVDSIVETATGTLTSQNKIRESDEEYSSKESNTSSSSPHSSAFATLYGSFAL